MVAQNQAPCGVTPLLAPPCRVSPRLVGGVPGAEGLFSFSLPKPPEKAGLSFIALGTVSKPQGSER